MEKLKLLGLAILGVVLFSLPAQAIFLSEDLELSLAGQASPGFPPLEVLVPKGENPRFSFPPASVSLQPEKLTLPEPINLFPQKESVSPEISPETPSLLKGLSAEEKALIPLEPLGINIPQSKDFSQEIIPKLNEDGLWEKFIPAEKRNLLNSLLQRLEERDLSKMENSEWIRFSLLLLGYPLEAKSFSTSEIKTLLAQIPSYELPQMLNAFPGMKEKIQEFLWRNEFLVLEKLKEFGLPGTILYAKEIFPYLTSQKQREVVKRILEEEKDASPIEKKLFALTGVQILELVNKKEIEELMEVVVNNLDAYEGNFLFFDLRGEKGVWDNLLKNGIKEIAEVWKNSGVILAVVSTASGIFLLSSLASLPLVGFIPKEVMSWEEFLKLVTKLWLESQKPIKLPPLSDFPAKENIFFAYSTLILLFWFWRRKIYAFFALKENGVEAMAKILIKAKPFPQKTNHLSSAMRMRINNLEEDVEKRLKRTKYWANYLTSLKSSRK
ncbi:MAG: hypothetical protein NC920_00485 [Candidatus Omnitrophica bacterium]|nr:hypothetical protein [Candidatus Omnitrophota bacterium]MCM8797977.1 hypothetical protein [Candidatus Omnitrophota bacterium]